MASTFIRLLPLLAVSTLAQGQSDVPKLAFEKYTLPNGLQVILHVDRKLPMVHVNCWYHVGSKNERFGRTGFAHLFEHMMFEGSKDANEKYFQLIERAGANLFEGGVNGTTSEDRTNYFENVPAGSLEYVLWLESDRLATLADVLTQTKLDNERDIVKNERRQGLENQPYGRWDTLLSENLYPFGHPYAHSVIGSHEDLTAATVEDVKQFFHTYYTPNNLSLAITGDFDVAKTKVLIEKYFGPVAPGPALDRPKLAVAHLNSQKVIEVKDHVTQERTYFAWPSPPFFGAGDAELELTALILTDGLSSRLTKSLVYDKQLCSDVVGFQNSAEIAGSFVLWATAAPGKSLADVEAAVTAEIARLAKDGPSAEELTRAKNKWELQFVTGLERIGGFGGQADFLNLYNTFLGDPDKFAADVQRHRSATTESIRQVTAAWLDNSNRLLLRFHPENAEVASAATPALDRSKRPELGTDETFHAPDVISTKLDNGLTILVMQRKDLPKVSVTFATNAGSADDPAGKEGLASLTLEVSHRGTKTRKALEIDNAFGNLGTSLGVEAGTELSKYSVEVLKPNVGPVIAELADIVLSPSFPAEEVDREKKKRLDAIAQAENSANGIARRVSTVLAYGREHAYGHPAQGFRASVETLSSEDMARFHNAYWKPGSSALVFAGDISAEEANALGKQYFGAWSGGAAPAPKVTTPKPLGPGKIFLINRPDAAQTEVVEVLPGPARNASDYYPLSLADTVWGGSASGRLGTNLREQKGYSYGVFSIPIARSKYGAWVAQGGVQTDKTKESVVEFEKELHNIAGEKRVSEEELTRARNFRLRGYAQQFESLGRVSEQIVTLWSLGLPTTELQREPDELGKATAASVNAAAEKYATPSRSSLLLVGDLSKIEADVRGLNLGEVVVLDNEGRPIGKK